MSKKSLAYFNAVKTLSPTYRYSDCDDIKFDAITYVINQHANKFSRESLTKTGMSSNFFMHKIQKISAEFGEHNFNQDYAPDVNDFQINGYANNLCDEYVSSMRQIKRYRQILAKKNTPMGIASIWQRSLERNRQAVFNLHGNSASDTTPDYSVDFALKSPEYKKIEMVLDGRSHELRLDVPYNWFKQVELLGAFVVENKIIKTAKYIGNFGDVDGFKASWYKRSVKSSSWDLEEGYIGRHGDTTKTCRSRMYIESVVKRKASSEFTEELLSAFD